MSFSERLRKIVELDFDSQNDLARQIEVSNVTISTYTSGKQKPKYDILYKFYNLGYSIDWLISGKGSMKRTFINEDELDEYDEKVFDSYFEDKLEKEGLYLWDNEKYINYTTEEINPETGKLIENRSNYKMALSKSQLIKKTIYQDFSVYTLYNSINSSVFVKNLKYLLTPKGKKAFRDLSSQNVKAITLDSNNNEKIEEKPLITYLLSKGNEIEEKEKINIEIKPKCNQRDFIKYLSCYIYLQVELDYYEQTVKESEELTTMEDENYQWLEYNVKFKEIKNLFKLQLDQLENIPYIESKALVFSGIVNNIFKIEQSK